MKISNKVFHKQKASFVSQVSLGTIYLRMV